MQITLYGTGSCMPSAKTSDKPFRSFTGWYMEIGSDSLLFDIGSGLLQKMLVDGKDILKNPTHVFISHFHPDHCSDLIALMQARFVAGSKTKMQPLLISGPAGLKEFCEDFFESAKKWFIEDQISQLIMTHEVPSGLVSENNNWKVASVPVNHFEGSVAYRLEVDGKSIVYSGDMAYDERICDLGKNADLAILECSYPDRKNLGKHLCPEDIGKLAKLGGFKKVVLTHMYPECAGREEEMIETIRKIVDVEVVVGYDFLKLDV